MFNIRKLFGEKGDNPLASVEEVTTILAHLPVNDPIQSLNELTHWLTQLATKDDQKLKKRLALVARFDQVGRPSLRKLLAEYVETPRMHKTREDMIWNACSQFTAAASDAASRCVSDYLTKGSSGVSPEEVAAIAVRGVRALGMQAHWLRLRYQPLPPGMWDRIYAIFSVMEQNRLCRMPVVLNKLTKIPSSVLMEMTKILMMEISGLEHLTKSQIELARQLIEEFAPSFVWEDLPGGEAVFYIDFAARKPPLRLTQVTEPHFMSRCFGPGDAVRSLVSAIKQLEAGGIPKEFDIRRYTDYKREDLLEVLLHLAQAWSRIKPQEEHFHYDKRRGERTKVFSHLEVIHGLGDIHKEMLRLELRAKHLYAEDNVEKVTFNEVVDLHIYGFVTEKTREQMKLDSDTIGLVEPPVHTESWVVENVSVKGYGLTIPDGKLDWVKENIVLGLKEEGSGWTIGVIRRIEMKSKVETHVGILMLSRQPMAASLRPADTEVTVWEIADDTNSYQHTNALFLRAEAPLLSEDSLLLASGTYNLHTIYELTTSEGKRLIRLDVCEDVYGDTDRVVFSLVDGGRRRE
jgi:hypothetical protein